MADDKADLLDRLRIERTEAPAHPRGVRPARGRWPPRLATLALVSLIAAALAWAYLASRPALAVKLVVAGPATTTAGGGALLDASGYVVARRRATVSSKITGRVDQVLIEEGQEVREGQVLARLDASNAQAALAQAQAQTAASQAAVTASQAAVGQAKPKLDRAMTLNAKGFLSDEDLEAVRATYQSAVGNLELARRQVAASRAGVEVSQRALDDTVVRAPFSGVVTVKAAQPGEMVSPISAGGGFTRTGIGTIVDMSSLEVEVDVGEGAIHRVHAGMPAHLVLNAYPDWTIPGHVVAVIPTADRSKATVTVRVGFDQPDPKIVPEMGARVSFLDGARGPPPSAVRGALVPASAIRPDGSGGGVVFMVEHGRARARAVRLGPSRPMGQVVTDGLNPGAAIVADAHIPNLKDGVRVRTAGAEPQP